MCVDVVREIHAEALAGFGGLDGVRDLALLKSAVAAPLGIASGTLTRTDATATLMAMFKKRR